MGTAVVCIRVKEYEFPVVDGSTKEICTKCHEEVWMSPETFKVYKECKDAMILCTHCAGFPDIDVSKIERLTEGQIEEAKKFIERSRFGS